MQKTILRLKIFLNANGIANPWDEIILKSSFALISSLLLLIIPLILASLIPVVSKIINKGEKKKIEKLTVSIYSFVCGFFITMALFGFLRESLEISSINAKSVGYTNNQVYGWNVLLVGSGLLSGLGLALLLKFLITLGIKKKKGKMHSAFIHDHFNDHHHEICDKEKKENIESHALDSVAERFQKNNKKREEKSDPSTKIIALILLLLHRIPEGFLIGITLGSFYNGHINNMNWVFLISFILHIIPEEIIFFVRQKEMGTKTGKSIGISMLCISLFIPFILVGIFVGNRISNLWQLSSFIEAMMAGIFIFLGIFEFLPEFIFAEHHSQNKYWIIISLFVGILISAIVLSVHTHGTGTIFGKL